MAKEKKDEKKERMKTLKEIEDSNTINGYLKHLGEAVEAIMPSIDGDPENRCKFIVLLAQDEDGGKAHYVSNGSREANIKWLRDTANRLERDAPPQEPGKLVLRRRELPGG